MASRRCTGYEALQAAKVLTERDMKRLGVIRAYTDGRIKAQAVKSARAAMIASKMAAWGWTK